MISKKEFKINCTPDEFNEVQNKLNSRWKLSVYMNILNEKMDYEDKIIRVYYYKIDDKASMFDDIVNCNDFYKEINNLIDGDLRYEVSLEP